MNRHLDMSCCMCVKQVKEVKHFSVDDSDNVIIMCDECYDKAKKFFKGGGNDVESGQRN